MAERTKVEKIKTTPFDVVMKVKFIRLIEAFLKKKPINISRFYIRYVVLSHIYIITQLKECRT